MKIKEGFVYHIRDEYFDLVQGCDIKNKANNGKTYPAYCCHKDSSRNIFWMIPMSTNIKKFEGIAEKEMNKYGHCYSVVIGMYDKKDAAFLIQDMFPITKKYILHEHTRKGKIISVNHSLKAEIRHNFDKIMELRNRDVKSTLTDIDYIMQLIITWHSNSTH